MASTRPEAIVESRVSDSPSSGRPRKRSGTARPSRTLSSVMPTMVTASRTQLGCTSRAASTVSCSTELSTRKRKEAFPARGADQRKASSRVSPARRVSFFSGLSRISSRSLSARTPSSTALSCRLVTTTPAVASSPARSRRGRAARTFSGLATRSSPSALPKRSSDTATAVVRKVVSESGRRKRAVTVPSGPVTRAGWKAARARKSRRTG